MKSTLKKILCAVLAAVLCAGLAGCYDEDKTWAAEKDELTLPIGGYLYFLSDAYYEAAGKLSSDTEVLKGTIDGKDAKDWIEERALNRVKAYYYIDSKFQELGLTMTEEDTATLESNTASMWSYSGSSLEELGIAKESFHLVASVYPFKYEKVFLAMYGEGGEKEVAKDDLKSYFVENYSYLESFSAPLTKTGDDDASTDLTDEEKEDLKKQLEDYAEKVNKGEITLSEAASDYASASGTESTYREPAASQSSYLESTISNALNSAKDNEAFFSETTSNYFVIRKLPASDNFEEFLETESNLTSLLSGLKSEEFSDYVTEQADAFTGVTVNDKAIRSVSVKSLVTDSNKMGTSSASSESEE